MNTLGSFFEEVVIEGDVCSLSSTSIDGCSSDQRREDGRVDNSAVEERTKERDIRFADDLDAEEVRRRRKRIDDDEDVSELSRDDSPSVVSERVL